MNPIEQLRLCTGFDWDDGNAGKNWEEHQVSDGECEQAFFNQPLIAMPDYEHSDEEDRILVLGKTDSGRKLFLVCTIRGDLIRVISARNMPEGRKRSISHMGKKRRFANEDEEREFWSDHDSAEHVDWTKAHRVTLPDLKPSLKTISIRLPSFMLEEIKQLAHKRDVPYQSLIKLFLAERVKRELQDDAA